MQSMKKSLKGKRALITGASGGIGAAIAAELASYGADLVLVARREDLLRKVAKEISARYNVTADILVKDLQEKNAPEDVFALMQKKGTAIDILVNNAGFGIYGNFIDIPWKRVQEMLNLNIVVLTNLTGLFARDMVKRGSGYIMLIASIGGFQPSPYYGAYSATKSYVLNFGEALHYELRNTGVSVTVVSPGVTRSEFLKVAGQEENTFQRMAMMPAEKVARIGVNALLKKKSGIVTGKLNAFTVWSNRFISRKMSAAVAGRFVK
jgi:uncharacterized protein